ncbi:MAG TPA: aminodeoxychorismate/anthranilate synthase component II [Opitutaceae bacterium]|nr:aminodeoxychorismate/anthranilate synthase component II [Opitutaceae bacterium]
MNWETVLLVIDNFDSFTYNLVQCFGQLGVEQRVFRNNEITPERALALNPDRVLLSPGPCTPSDAGVTLDMIAAFAGRRPIFGVCLGHQAVGQHFGGRVVRAGRLMHGKTSPIIHRDTDLFRGLPQGFPATRYHSLLVERSSFPKELEITAETAEGEVMGLRHRSLPIWGVQFHPESIATRDGMKILENFLGLN